ncbi:MAG: hypothetical protein A3J63_02530 [Candidatus Moranbacteria bacterium RIFCSPHIGHO2_02_FULL_40_12b]|nr:MAG: hypothetical protein A3J63_02530 [Candidatus Moranbacteria bacterium RIFCSPHIGHO2_02_FULL_40_12b]
MAPKTATLPETETSEQMKINTYKVTCRGISPILMNPATEELLNQLDGGAGARTPKDMVSTPEQKAERKIIRDENGNVGVPSSYLFSCLREAGRRVPYDAKTKISTKESTILPGLMSIVEIFIPFIDQDAKWEVDRRRGMLPKDGTAVCITRPRFNEWAFAVTIEVDEGQVSPGKIKELFKVAGRMVGLGDFRPSCNGQFGRFRVENWEKIKET